MKIWTPTPHPYPRSRLPGDQPVEPDVPGPPPEPADAPPYGTR